MGLLRLPDEILLMIFSHLSIVDQERLSGTCQRLKTVSSEKRLYRFVSLFGQFSCTKEMFHLVLKPRYRGIIHLDITSCYWLPPGDICKHVSKMDQLESLYAVDTQLDVFHIIQLSQKLRNLKRLSFNWSSEPLENNCPNPLLQLQFLYVYVTKWGVHFSTLLSWLESCKSLQELWILSYGSEGNQLSPVYRPYNFSFPALETLVINVADASSYISHFLRDLVLGASRPTFRCMWLGFHDPFSRGSPSEKQFCNVEYLFPYPPLLNIPSRRLKSVCPDKTVNLMASEYPSLIHLHLRPPAVEGTEDIDPAVLDNLESIMYTLPCSSSYMNEVTTLFSPSNKLRKVTLKYLHGTAVVSDQRRKIEDFLVVLSKSCLQITELDIRGCTTCVTSSSTNSEHLSNIWKFVNLRKLALHYLNIQDARFLLKITSNCENLQSISLNSLGLQGHCVYLPDICNALKHCKVLRDFRIEHSNLGKIESLLEHLKLCPLVERVVIRSIRNKIKPDLASIIDIIAKSSKLVYFMCAMPSVTQQQEKTVNKIVKERFLKERPALIVRVTQDMNVNRNVPGLVHASEMVSFHPALGPVEASIHITGLP
ncbi:uncharacterized protein LOC126281738 isoform X1 [Schistocerca gregaria]|uniref:uncharacterized protein LOC126281738 isoform X1 n=1 Tax=Schistocerca gregaria TaxID=7010 RepID=UPI00211EC9FF|nr:uncharacterized protein LOC126281738 isoform X1 [Schistocerca gregaria]XP_049836881.1 uncharacterized protein LOC126281738 isoform X1 [Schistocerca gregaria]